MNEMVVKGIFFTNNFYLCARQTKEGYNYKHYCYKVDEYKTAIEELQVYYIHCH